MSISPTASDDGVNVTSGPVMSTLINIDVDAALTYCSIGSLPIGVEVAYIVYPPSLRFVLIVVDQLLLVAGTLK